MGEDVELELAHARRVSPGDRLLEQGRPDTLPPCVHRDHQPQVGNMAACRVRVARDREAADDHPVVLGEEHGGVGVVPNRLQVPALVGDRAPAALRDQPALGLRPDRLGEIDERRSVARPGRSHQRAAHPTTIPCPPRRGSPAAASLPPAPTSTAATPPKYRLRRRQRTTS